MVVLSLAVKNQRSTARSQHQHVVAVVVALREADFVEALVAVARGVLRLLPARDRAAADVKPVCYGSGSNCAFLHQPLVLPNGLLMAGAIGFGDSAVARVLTVLVPHYELEEPMTPSRLLDLRPPQRDCASSAQLSHDPIDSRFTFLLRLRRGPRTVADAADGCDCCK